MRTYIWDKIGVGYVSNPKAASAAIVASMISHFGEPFSCPSRDLALDSGSKLFTVVREPIARFASCLRYLRRRFPDLSVTEVLGLTGRAGGYLAGDYGMELRNEGTKREWLVRRHSVLQTDKELGLWKADCKVKLEEWPKMKPALFQELGIETIDVGRKNATKRTRSDIEEIGEENMRNVLKFCYADFKTFNYDIEKYDEYWN